MSAPFIHLHFGAGRLGLGLIAPWFQKPGSKLYLFNRAVSEANPTGATGLDPARRNQSLQDQPEHVYSIRQPGAPDSGRTPVHYDGFFAYDEATLAAAVEQIADGFSGQAPTVIVTASVLKVENYPGVIQALNVLSRKREEDSNAVGRIFLVACENTLSAIDVFEHESLADLIPDVTRRHVTPVHALVVRTCVGLEEDRSGAHPILQRFAAIDDPISRILARFQSPSPEQQETIVAFSKRFADRINEPIHAYQEKKGTIPPAASQSIFSLYQLIANDSFIDKLPASEPEPELAHCH